MQILYQLGICFTRWRTGSTGRRGYALEMDKQLSKYNLSRKHCSAVHYNTSYHQTCISRLIWWAQVWWGMCWVLIIFSGGVKTPGVTRISSPVPRAGLVTASQTRGFLLHLLIKMRERRFYNLLGFLIRVNVLKKWVPLIDIGSVSNSRKDFLEPDLIENISAESIAKTDLEN